jgi:hypothetical protein
MRTPREAEDISNTPFCYEKKSAAPMIVFNAQGIDRDSITAIFSRPVCQVLPLLVLVLG